MQVALALPLGLSNYSAQKLMPFHSGNTHKNFLPQNLDNNNLLQLGFTSGCHNCSVIPSVALHVAFTQSGLKISHWYVLPGRYLKPPLPSSKTLRSMLYGLVESVCAVAGWLGVTVEQASKGAPVGKEMTGTTVETSNTTATRALMINIECVLHLHNTIRS